MKKFVALLLALLLVLVNVVALAGGDIEDPDSPQIPEKADEIIENEPTRGGFDTGEGDEPTFKKKYTSDKGVYPNETLTFTVTPAVEDYPTITVGEDADNTFVVSGETDEYTIPINVPGLDVTGGYSDAGKYSYTIVEIEGDSQGATYSAVSTTINVDVYVYFEKENDVMVKKQKVAVWIDDDETKSDEIENTYEVGKLTVSKAISGNLADPDAVFTFEVVLSTGDDLYVRSDISITPNGESVTVKEGDTTYDETIPYGDGWTGEKTLTITLKGGDSVDFTNIPAGVSYKATEKLIDGENVTKLADNEATTQLNNANDVTAYYVEGDMDEAAEIAAGAEEEAAFTNTKGIDIPTGISLETLPYVLILAVAMIGIAVKVFRKREEY